ncbi:DNA topoisomerase 1 alpha-like [Mercurialis annua]|uniref:DNA topoisomerase 1 alpha-like n=1 Tax=Mercurialis annua TaxID=3986 RepID=UPI002160F7E1|nr:DNA topoisomerase 1 alpha-like [Mercurialis annua]XP_055960539.1 DNA topoisomerase 1 alpha-like [Mercurialis annua]
MTMAAPASAKTKAYDYDDDDEDDMPLVFKRSSHSTSKQNQSSTADVKKPLSSSQSSNGQSSNAQKGKTAVPSSKGPPVKSPIGSPKASTSSAKVSPLRSPVANSKGSGSVDERSKQISKQNAAPLRSPVANSKGSGSVDERSKQTSKQNAAPLRSPVANSKGSGSVDERSKQISKQNVTPLRSPVANSKGSSSVDERPKQISKQNASNSVKEEVNSVKREPELNSVKHGIEPRPIKPETETKNDDDDSEDDMPLSARKTGNSSTADKGINSNNGNKVVTAPSPVKDEESDDEDDKVPLSSRFPMKSSAGTSGIKSNNISEKKPLASKFQQNGSTSKDKQQKEPLGSTKRPADKANLPDNSSAKRPKLSDASTIAKVKQVTVKADSKEDEDDIPIAQRKKNLGISENKLSSAKKKTAVFASSSKKMNKNKKQMKNTKYSKSTKLNPSSSDGQKKWTTLEHNGVIFPPPYKPHGIKILYKGKPVVLTPEQEEVATMFAVMKETDYMQKPQFLENFWTDWRKILGKNHVIQNLQDCDFTPIYEWHEREKEKKKQMSSEEKKELKEEKMKQEEKYMWAVVDGVKEKVGNFRVEPPGLFRGRGEHPKMGKLKRRIQPSDITINIGKASPIPECPIPGESWKEVKHDNTVTWLAFWNDPINQKEFKYVFLAASSSLKGQSDKEKYEKARKLKDYIHNIRAAYQKDFRSKDPTKKQIAVATYLIDKLALRAGNEKDDDEADTVGCCTLKVANVECISGSHNLKFDFLGKDSIRYENTVEVKPEVYDAIGTFQKGKKQTDDLFDKLDTTKLNAHLKELMPGLTAKVFRTYNASITLDEKLYEDTEDGDVAENVVIYQKANKEVAIICNHQRTISKTHGAQMSKLIEKIDELKDIVKDLKTDLDRAKKGRAPLKDTDGKRKRVLTPEAIEKKIASTNQRIDKMELAMKTKEDLKTVALGTSKINYLDPRITVAWCKRHDVPIEKIFNKSLLAKFTWAMDVDPQFRF